MLDRTSRLALAAVLVVVAGAGCQAPAAPTPTVAGGEYRVTVVSVVDGDTMDVRYPNGTTDTVRLLGVDTPETRAPVDPAEYEGVPDTAAGRACLRAAGENATRFARAFVGDRVTVELDPSADTRGRYGRLLGYVRADAGTLNAALLREGHARLFDSQFREREAYAAAEDAARDADRGLWRCR